MKLNREKIPSSAIATIRLFLLMLVICFMVVARELLIPLTISVFLTFILLPVSRKLEEYHIMRPIAVLLSILLALIIVAGLVWFISIQISSFSDDSAQLKEKMTEKLGSVQRFIRSNFHISTHEQREWIERRISDTVEEGDQYLLTFFTITGTFLTNLALIPLYVYFITIYRGKLKTFIRLITNGENKNAIRIMQAVSHIAQKYLKGLMIDVAIVSILCSLGFLILGVKHSILFGLLVAICNIVVPYMGVTIASIFPFFMMVITHDDLLYALGTIGICILVQFIDNHFINPYIVGSSVSINPLTAFIALVASAMIWGIPGMLLCIPGMGMIKVVCDNVEKLKPYGYIIGREKEFAN